MTKRIVICSDGTWNTPDQKDGGEIRPSNVVKMARAIAPTSADGKAQVVFYDQGVGTHWGLDRWTGGAFGIGLSKNIEDAYRFLVNNYDDGDDIFLFGFSRGAYTARSTAGLIRNSGLLRVIYADKFKEAFKLYRSKEVHPNDDIAKKFRQDYSREVRIKFIGVWDTVGSLGIPFGFIRSLTKHRHQFHDVQLSSYVDNAYHALAIDEKRKPFKPTLWQTKNIEGQNVEQVWFSGVHSNIGGGYKDSGLSDLAFIWMKEKAESCGLAFDQEYMETIIHPDYAGVLRNSKKGIYKLLGSYTRPICAGNDSHESVHQSADDRYDNISSYKPENLTEYRNQQKE